MPIIQEENQAKSTVQTGQEMEIPTKEASEVEELSQGPTVDISDSRAIGKMDRSEQSLSP